MLAKFRRLLAAPNLQELAVHDPRILSGEKVSDNVKTMYFHLPGDCKKEDVWVRVDPELSVPKALDKVIVCCFGDEACVSLTNGETFFALFSKVSSLKFVGVTAESFWEACASFDHVRELEVDFDRANIPIQRFVNLETLVLTINELSDLRDVDFFMPRLARFQLKRVDHSCFEKEARDLWEYLGVRMPSLKHLALRLERCFMVNPSAYKFTSSILEEVFPRAFKVLENFDLSGGDYPFPPIHIMKMVTRFEQRAAGGLKRLNLVIGSGPLEWKPRFREDYAVFQHWLEEQRRNAALEVIYDDHELPVGHEEFMGYYFRYAVRSV